MMLTKNYCVVTVPVGTARFDDRVDPGVVKIGRYPRGFSPGNSTGYEDCVTRFILQRPLPPDLLGGV